MTSNVSAEDKQGYVDFQKGKKGKNSVHAATQTQATLQILKSFSANEQK